MEQESQLQKLQQVLVDQKRAESEYGISITLQERLRKKGQSAPWLKIGRKVFYVRVELDAWIQEQKAKAMAARRGGAVDAD